MAVGIARLVLNRKNIAALLKSDAVEADLRRRAVNIAQAAGPGHRVDSAVGKNRARAAVITATQEARESEARDRSLSRAIFAGRADT